MTTDIGEIPLLNMASVMLAVLKAAAQHAVTAADCVARLLRNLARVHEDAESQRGELEQRVAIALGELTAAGLVAAAGEGRFRLTARGRTVLDQHPLGVDETVLAEFREFREFVKRLAPRPGECETPGPKTPANQAYLDGYGACMAGRRMTDNPHPVDTAEHMAWDAGWFEAMDEAIERHEGAASAGEGGGPQGG